MGEKRWTEMTADEQVPPWGLLVDQLVLRNDLDAWNEAAEADDCRHEDVIQERAVRGVVDCVCRDCGARWKRA